MMFKFVTTLLNKYLFVFISQSWLNGNHDPNCTIVGILHEDRNLIPANVAIIQGGIEFPFVQFRIEAQLGEPIVSNFYFYKRRGVSVGNRVEDFLESEFILSP